LANPNRIFPGDVIYYQLNAQSTSFAQAYESTPRQQITVQPGDTLATIAQNVLGNGKAWKHIWRQNDTVNNPDRLEVGQTIYYIAPGALTAQLNKIRTDNITQTIQTKDNIPNNNLVHVSYNNIDFASSLAATVATSS
jgi:LysM repeat protein